MGQTRDVIFNLKLVNDPANAGLLKQLGDSLKGIQSGMHGGGGIAGGAAGGGIKGGSPLAAGGIGGKDVIDTIKKAGEQYKQMLPQILATAKAQAQLKKEINETMRSMGVMSEEDNRIHKRSLERKQSIAKQNRAAREQEAKDEEKLVKIHEEGAERIKRSGEEVRNGLLHSAHGLMKMARGVELLGLVGEESLQKWLDTLARVEGTISLIQGGVKVYVSLTEAVEGYRAAVAAAAATEAAAAAIRGGGGVAGAAGGAARGASWLGGLGSLGGVAAMAMASSGPIAALIAAIASVGVVGKMGHEIGTGTQFQRGSWNRKSGWFGDQIGHLLGGDKETKYYHQMDESEVASDKMDIKRAKWLEFLEKRNKTGEVDAQLGERLQGARSAKFRGDLSLDAMGWQDDDWKQGLSINRRLAAGGESLGLLGHQQGRNDAMGGGSSKWAALNQSRLQAISGMADSIQAKAFVSDPAANAKMAANSYELTDISRRRSSLTASLAGRSSSGLSTLSDPERESAEREIAELLKREGEILHENMEFSNNQIKSRLEGQKQVLDLLKSERDIQRGIMEGEQDRLKSAAERFADMSPVDRSRLKSLKHRVDSGDEEALGRLTTEDRHLLKASGLRDLEDAASRSAMIKARHEGFDDTFVKGSSESKRIGEASAAQLKIDAQVAIAQKLELELPSMNEEFIRKLANRLREINAEAHVGAVTEANRIANENRGEINSGKKDVEIKESVARSTIK